MAPPRLRRRPNPEGARTGRRPRADRGSWILFSAALFATAEIAFGLLISRFFDWGRAEALLFFAVRPWLLLIAAMGVADRGWRRRYSLYLLAIAVVGISESLLLIKLGATDPWPEMFRGWVGGGMVAVVCDLVIQSGRRFSPKRGAWAAAGLLGAVLLIPGGLRPFEIVVLDRAVPVARNRPDVIVITSLPIIWGEQGPFEPGGGGPAASWRALAKEFHLRPIDSIDRGSLTGTRLMLLAQPRQLAPGELVAVDQWVRSGGAVLILADPALVWPSRLPVGDVRRPARINMLTPLLAHWGIGYAGALIEAPQNVMVGRRRLSLSGTAVLSAEDPHCIAEAPFMLDCPIGDGRAIIVADADLLHDSTSLPTGAAFAARHDRLSDNVPAIADWLDRLGRVERSRALGNVQWLQPGANRGMAVLFGFAPIAILLALALVAERRQRKLTNLSTDGGGGQKDRTNQE